MRRNPKTVLVPFGYPGYPDEYLIRFAKESEKTIKNQGIDVKTTPIVKAFSDSNAAAGIIRNEDADFITVLILSWLEAPNVVETLRESFGKPILLWAHTMFHEKGEKLTLGPMPAAGVIRQTFEEMGVNFRFIWGMPEEQKIKDAIKIFSRASFAAHELSHSKIGLLGYVSMGMYTACFDHLPLREKLGPEIDQLDQYAIIKRIEEMPDDKVKDLVKAARTNWVIGEKVTEKDLAVTLKMYLALKEIAAESGWRAFTVKCQYELSKYYKTVPCVPLSMLGNEIPCSCEGDIPLICSQLILHYLTGKIASYGDIHAIEENGILIGACGYAPFALAEGKPIVDKTTVLYEGLANCTVYKEGEVTLARLGYMRDRNLKMHIVTGDGTKPEPFHEVGCLPYPCMRVKLHGSTEEFGGELMSQHYAIVYGNYKKELLEFCRLMKIKPVLP